MFEERKTLYFRIKTSYYSVKNSGGSRDDKWQIISKCDQAGVKKRKSCTHLLCPPSLPLRSAPGSTPLYFLIYRRCSLLIPPLQGREHSLCVSTRHRKCREVEPGALRSDREPVRLVQLFFFFSTPACPHLEIFLCGWNITLRNSEISKNKTLVSAKNLACSRKFRLKYF